MHPREILREAARLIRKGWTKEVFARDINDRPVDVLDNEACKFCMYGAVDRACNYSNNDGPEPEELRVANKAVGKFLREKGGFGIAEWNDYHATSAEEVASTFEKVAEAL